MRWYLSYPLSYRQLSEIMQERGIKVNYTTIYKWVQSYAPQLDKHCRPILLPKNDSWRVDETYIRVKGKWKYLYRAVDSTGSTLDFLLCAERDCQATKRFLSKAMKVKPRLHAASHQRRQEPCLSQSC